MEVLLPLKRHLKAIDLELDTAQRVAKIEAPRCRDAGTLRDKRKMRIGWKVSHWMVYVCCSRWLKLVVSTQEIRLEQG